MNKRNEKGFTLIELMIVVAIIGILAAVAIPKFADLIRKSKEGATKGCLGALRSAVSIYYGETEGTYPVTIASADFTTKYMDSIPTVKLGLAAHGTDTAAVVIVAGDTAGWCYTAATGAVVVNCTHADTRGTVINLW